MRRPSWLGDPATPSFLLFGSLIGAGFVCIGFGWRVAARTLLVPFQTPALVSGAMGGLALVVLGAGLVNVQAGRRFAAVERAETEALLDQAAEIVDAFRRDHP